MAANPEANYRNTIRSLSDRIVTAQAPIRILDAIKWDNDIQLQFFADGAKELPRVDRAYYEQRPLEFDPSAVKEELHDIERDVVRQLGKFNPVGQIMSRVCREYRMVVRMLEARGLPEFNSISEELYGASTDAFHAGEATLLDFGEMMAEALKNVDNSPLVEDDPREIAAQEAVQILQERLDSAFSIHDETVRVMVSDGIVADAAAGSGYVKLRADAMFNMRDLRLLEIHEGWVHIGTTINGSKQPICTFLSKGPPSSTVTQEGLAVLMELITFASYPARLRKTTNRIRAVHMAEEGADFIQVYRFFQEHGYNEEVSYQNAMRVFRGSVPDGGPFTKDLSYNKGFILVYNYIRLAVVQGMLDRIPLLFCGKTTLEDMRTLHQLVQEGIVEPPRFLPPQFADMKALIAWMCYANFINRLDLQRVDLDYANIL
ncbi:MAG: flavohemoglobin expression-modulating QEGLA motif protein [Candidatus Hydrogenedens sp.]|nr:flavohemoglobin expression-modulating QEGLA motif protein [Candidatus Hydrogenedens sp.]